MKSKLLVVDDSATILKIVSMAFEKENVTVQGTDSGEEALKKMQEFQPDIVVAGADMPGMTGFQLCQKIKDSDEFKSVPVLLLINDVKGFDEVRFNECKADDHISKPFKSDGIVNKVKQLLEGPPDDMVEKPGVLKLSADDMVEKPGVVKLSEDDAVEEVPDTGMDFLEGDAIEEVADADMDFLEDDGLKDLLDGIIDDSVLPDDSPGEIVKPEPVTEQSAPMENEETDETLDKSADEISLEEMLESAEELLIAELEEENDQETAPPETENIGEESVEVSVEDEIKEVVPNEASSPSAELEEENDQETAPPEIESIGEESVEVSVEDEIKEVVPNEASSPSVEETLPEDSAPPKTAHVEEPEPEMTATPSDFDDFQEEEKKTTPQVSARAENDDIEEEMSIEDMLTSAEELLKDNYLEKMQDADTEQETTSVPLQDVEPDAGGVFQEQETVTAAEQPVTAEAESLPEEESLADVDSPVSNSMDEGDSIFDAIQNFDESVEFAETAGKSHIYVEPESENLLEEMAPSAFTSKGIEGKPDLIQETLSYLSDLSPTDAEEENPSATQPRTDQQGEPPAGKATAGDMFSEVVGEHIQQILERSLQNAIAKEISGLSRTIERSVQEIVKEVTPGIARAIIQEEIEKIRKMEEA